MADLRTAVIKESYFTLEVSGYFEKGESQTWDDPGTGDSFEINHVVLEEGELIDVLFWLDGIKNSIEYIEDICIDKINEY